MNAKKTLGALIAENRKQKGMTQLELAAQLGVTDKAVSKWERDLACPDINTLPALADALGLTLDELMQGRSEKQPGKTPGALAGTILKAVALAMGVAVAALSALGALTPQQAMPLLGLGLACLAAHALQSE